MTLTPPFVVNGANAADFAVEPPGTTALAPGASTTVSVSFHPLSAGAKAAGVAITTTGGGTTVALSGTATAGISVNPAFHDFGSIDIGSSAGTSITITNDDTAPATLTPPFALTGPNAAEFSVGVPGTTMLAGGESTSVVVGFQPSSAGGKNATLSITSAAGSVRHVSLTGSSACPAIVVGGSLTTGLLGSPYSQTLIASGGAPPYTFTVPLGTPPTGLTVSSGGVVSGIPTVASTFTFTVQATDAVGCAGTAPFTVTILAATLSAQPSPLDFGPVNIGASASRDVTITNTSGFPVSLNTPFAITGTDGAQFSVGLPATATLAPGATTTASVTFGPTSFGTKTATLNVTSNAGGIATATLTGRGLNTSVGHTLLISEFRFRGPGGANDEFVEIYNNGATPIDISGYLLRGSNSAGTVTTRATVGPGVSLPAYAHYLFVNGAAGAVIVALANQTYSTGFTDDGGVAIARGDGTILDQVGLSTGSAFVEGTPLASLGSSNLDRGYERKPGGADGSTSDLGDNSSDFQVLAPSAPQNLNSPIVIPVIKCDADRSGIIDRADLTIIRNANGLAATGPADPRDGNSDGSINLADVRYLSAAPDH